MAENFLASPGPLPVEIAAALYTNRVMEYVRSRMDPDPERLVRTDDDLRDRVQAVAELACRVERERGSRPARRRFPYAERHGHAIGVFHPPADGPAKRPEEEQIDRLGGRLHDAQNEIIRLTVGPESATEQLKRANAASYGYFERGEYLTRLLFWHRVALYAVATTAVVCWLI